MTWWEIMLLSCILAATVILTLLPTDAVLALRKLIEMPHWYL